MLDFNPTHTWPVRIEFPNEHLAPVEKIALQVLYIKLDLFLKYVKALEKGSDCFKFICSCQNIKKSEAKLCNGVFTGPEIRYFMSLDDFPGTMTETKREAWFKHCDVAKHVLGMSVTEDCKENVYLLIKCTCYLSTRTNLKI